MIAVLSSSAHLNAQDPLDGPARIFNDDLLNNLVGDWNLKREIQGRTVENTVRVEWVLNHQFLRIHMQDVKRPATLRSDGLRWLRQHK